MAGEIQAWARRCYSQPPLRSIHLSAPTARDSTRSEGLAQGLASTARVVRGARVSASAGRLRLPEGQRQREVLRTVQQHRCKGVRQTGRGLCDRLSRAAAGALREVRTMTKAILTEDGYLFLEVGPEHLQRRRPDGTTRRPRRRRLEFENIEDVDGRPTWPTAWRASARPERR